MKAKLKYLVHISLNPSEYESFEILPIYTDYGALKSPIEEVIVPSDSSSSPHQIDPCMQVEVGEL